MVEKIIGENWKTTNYGTSNHYVFPNRYIYRAIKKMADILLAILGLVTCAPIIAAAIILIKLETKGSIIYTQERVGKNGRLFDIYKLRTMYSNAENDGIKWAQKDDPRATRVGRFLRKTRIDELPQLVNVLKGEMSIIGPRPERPYFIEEFSKKIPSFNERLAVLPGITGWSQVKGGYDLSPEEKLEKDLYYIRNQSVLLDIVIIIYTIRVILTFEGAR